MKRVCSVAILGASLFLSGCIFGSPGITNDDPAGGGSNSYAADQAEYDQLALQLLQDRDYYLGEEADEIQAAGDRLYWLQFPGLAPTVHSERAGFAVDYAMWIGDATYSYRASSEMLVTVEYDGDTVRYFAYGADSANALLGQTEFAAPTDEQRWWAYAVDASSVYVVTTGTETRLFRWVPGNAPTVVTTLEQAGASVGIFFDFDVQDDDMVFVESGRIWHLDLSKNVATWLGNETELTSTVSFDSETVTFATHDGLFEYRHANGQLVNLSSQIRNSGYELNETYDSIHLFADEGFTRLGERVIYIGGSGVFSYDVASDRIDPILLEPREADLRTVYRNPQVLQDGTLFLQALESESGSIGADGPIYRVISSVLR